MATGDVFRADAPDYLNLRKAARAAIAAPLVLAVGEVVLDNDTLALYGVFAAIVGLVFADFGGPAPQRAKAYLLMILLGSTMIALGAALSALPVAAVVGMFVVGFGASMASSFGGYAPLHVSGLALAYSLSVLQPLQDLDVRDRIAGWVLGGGVAMVAALTCWPVERRTGLRIAAANLCGQIAEVLRAEHGPDTRAQLADLRRRGADLHARMTTPLRPFGAAAHDVALFNLIVHVEQAVDLVGDLVERVADTDRDLDAEAVESSADGALAADVAAAMERTRSVLLGDVPPDSETAAIERLGTALGAGRHRIEDVVAHIDRDDVGLDVIRDAIPLRTLSHLTIWIEFEAARSTRAGQLAPPTIPVAPEVSTAAPSADLRSSLDRARSFLRWELDPDSVITKNSLRVGTSLAVAVGLAEVLDVEHGFWIVLATLLVLRSSAASTSTNALAAVVGTAGGFVVAVVVLELAGDSDVVLWLLFPVVVFFSGYTPGTLGVGFGQATFAVNVIVLFVLTDGPGVPTALIRVEDVTLGAVVAVVLGVVMWPRGARAVLAATVADSYRAAAAATALFVDGAPEPRRRADARLIATRRRAEEALCTAIAEHGERITMRSWVAVLRPLALVRALVIGLVPTVQVTRGACADAVAAAKSEAAAVGARFERTADALSSPSAPVPSTGRPPEPAPEPYERCIDERRGDDDALFDAIALVAWSSFITEVDRDLVTADDDIRTVAAAAAPRAWLVGARRGSS